MNLRRLFPRILPEVSQDCSDVQEVPVEQLVEVDHMRDEEDIVKRNSIDLEEAVDGAK